MSLLKFICTSAIVGAALTLSAHAQTVDPMRTACANEDYAHSNSDICVALAKTPVTFQPIPEAYFVLPSGRPTPFYGSLERCRVMAKTRIEAFRHDHPDALMSSPEESCIPAK